VESIVLKSMAFGPFGRALQEGQHPWGRDERKTDDRHAGRGEGSFDPAGRALVLWTTHSPAPTMCYVSNRFAHNEGA
jgi:hypothetical protein